MTSLLSNLADNLAEGIHKIRRKDCDCFLEYERVKNSLININTYLPIKIIQIGLMKNYKSDLKTYLSFLIIISINYFCC